MNKPVIFFSHSSFDKKPLIKLKDLFLAKTGNTIDVFLSSDGQSIPLGRNWIYKIQESLNECKIMVVFLTPNSIKSSWVYFESGFVHSKGIRVIPVGFLGLDLNSLHPPLSLLQGFNITSEDGLNNLIAIVNEEFAYKHGFEFTKDDYCSIIGLSVTKVDGAFGSYTKDLEKIHIRIEDESYKGLKSTEDNFNHMVDYFQKNNYECQINDNSINCFGLSISKSHGVYIDIDPIMVTTNLPIVENATKVLKTEGIKNFPLEFVFSSFIDKISDVQKISARLYNSGISFAKNEGFNYKDLIFEIFKSYNSRGEHSQIYIKIQTQTDTLNLTNVKDLIELLFIKEIIYYSDEVYF